jgi:hypothetical protein
VFFPVGRLLATPWLSSESHMRRTLLALSVVLPLLVVAGLVGWFYGSRAATRREIAREASRQKELMVLDESFLAKVAVRPGAPVSGKYVLETSLPGKAPDAAVVEAEFSNGQLVSLTGVPVQGIVQTGQVVSWEWEYADPDEGPVVRYVGLVDGDAAWGRVYVAPGEGWHEGEPPACGVWRLSPKAPD